MVGNRTDTKLCQTVLRPPQGRPRGQQRSGQLWTTSMTRRGCPPSWSIRRSKATSTETARQRCLCGNNLHKGRDLGQQPEFLTESGIQISFPASNICAAATRVPHEQLTSMTVARSDKQATWASSQNGKKCPPEISLGFRTVCSTLGCPRE